MEFSSKFIENAVNEISNLPGIGKKSALRLVLFLLRQPESQSKNLANAISEMRLNVNFCKNCHNISDLDICEICSNPRRDQSIICVVEDIRDVMAIEKTSSFNGLYHVLGGKISPVDGIGPDDLNIESLVEKVKNNPIKENLVAASDAFFPFVDGIEKLVQSGVGAVIQPSGSIRDKEIIKFANETNTVLVFSNTRHFRH